MKRMYTLWFRAIGGFALGIWPKFPRKILKRVFSPASKRG
jgi:hypothetical protein